MGFASTRRRGDPRLRNRLRTHSGDLRRHDVADVTRRARRGRRRAVPAQARACRRDRHRGGREPVAASRRTRRRCTRSTSSRRRLSCRSMSRCIPGTRISCCPRYSKRFAGEGRNVDFVLVDGDHSSDGVKRDIEDLLNSDAVRRTHDHHPRRQQRAGPSRRRRASDIAHGERSRTWSSTGCRATCSARSASATSCGAASASSSSTRRVPRTPIRSRCSSVTTTRRPLFAEMRDVVVAREQDTKHAGRAS